MIKLQQGQIWKTDNTYVRIVEVDRVEVHYKEMEALETRDGYHKTVSKKQFCRLIKGAELFSDG